MPGRPLRGSTISRCSAERSYDSLSVRGIVSHYIALTDLLHEIPVSLAAAALIGQGGPEEAAVPLRFVIASLIHPPDASPHLRRVESLAAQRYHLKPVTLNEVVR